MRHSNALNEIEDNVLWEGDSSRDDYFYQLDLFQLDAACSLKYVLILLNKYHRRQKLERSAARGGVTRYYRVTG